MYPLCLETIQEEGVFTVRCQELELASCGPTQLEAFKNFLEALRMDMEFLRENRERLSPELHQRFSLYQSAFSFAFVRRSTK
jgi:hypothetical protein